MGGNHHVGQTQHNRNSVVYRTKDRLKFGNVPDSDPNESGTELITRIMIRVQNLPLLCTENLQ